MPVVGRGVVALLLTSVLVTGAVGPAVAVGSGAFRNDDVGYGNQANFVVEAVGDRDLSDVILTQEFRLTPSNPGRVIVQHLYVIPDRVRSLRVDIPKDARVVHTSGFDQETGRTFHWDESTDVPTITYSIPVNRTVNVSSSDGTNGTMLAVDTGEWALFRRPVTSARWNYVGEFVGFERKLTTAGPGATGEWLVFLGAYTAYERTAHGQHFRLIVPTAANMTADPRDVLSSLTAAADALHVGDRDDDVFVVAAPTDGVSWAVRGLQVGDADFWVRDIEPLANATNIWLHEYVHTRQRFSLSPKMQWFQEATASYYAALLTFQQGRISFESFITRLADGANGTDADAILANQSTWQHNPQYTKGALVVGQLDRRIRRIQNQEHSFQTVFREMNGLGKPTSLSSFLALVGEYGDDNLVNVTRRYVTTASTVPVWNLTAHLDAFGRLPARIDFQLPGPGNNGSYAVTGPYRTATIQPNADGVIVIVRGETLHVGAVVTNSGGTAGGYTVSLAVNGTVVDRFSGTISPNGSERVPLSHTFETTGPYTVSVDSENVTVRVREPASAHVVNFTIQSSAIGVDEFVTATVVVENDERIPGAATVDVLRNGDVFTTTYVTVGSNTTTSVSIRIPFHEPGTALVSVNRKYFERIVVRPPSEQTLTDTVDTDHSSNDSVPTERPEPPSTETPLGPDSNPDDSLDVRGTPFTGGVVFVGASVAFVIWLYRTRR